MSLNNPLITPVHVLPEISGRKGQGGRRVRRQKNGNDKKKPLLSIVTITLDNGIQLEKTMQSVLQWPTEQVEYIIIDGGSKDSTIDLLREVDSRVEYWVSEPDAGISDAFNKGISLCRGTVVGLLNAGDWYEQTALASVEAAFLDNPDAEVVCGRLQFRKGNKKAYCTDSIPEFLPRDMTVAHPSCFVKRNVYLRLGGFNPEYRLAMDYELLLRFFLGGVVFARTPAVLANMQHDGVSEANWQQALAETHRARQLYMSRRSFYTGRIYLNYLIGRRYVRLLLQSLGLNGLVAFYRKHLAAVQKVKM
ncbi:MAG TPA: glycosyltransferase [Desulfobulbus sp.]|nr:glycosyltransferase [Desulfobulbus sp.]